VKDYLATAGYSPAYGARPLSRLIEKEVLNPLAILILKGAVKDGEVARVIMRDGRITVLPNHVDYAREDEEMVDTDEELIDDLEDDVLETDLYE